MGKRSRNKSPEAGKEGAAAKRHCRDANSQEPRDLPSDVSKAASLLTELQPVQAAESLMVWNPHRQGILAWGASFLTAGYNEKQKAAVLVKMEASVAARILDEMQAPDAAAAILNKMQPSLTVAGILGEMDTSKAAAILPRLAKAEEILGMVENCNVAAILVEMEAPIAASILPDGREAEILGGMNDSSAAELLVTMETCKIIEIFDKMKDSSIAGILVKMETSKAASLLPHGREANILGEMKDSSIAGILVKLEASKAASLLPDGREANIMGEMEDSSAVGILVKMEASKAASLLPDGREAGILSKMDKGSAAGILVKMEASKVAEILSKMKNSSIAGILFKMEASKAASLLPDGRAADILGEMKYRKADASKLGYEPYPKVSRSSGGCAPRQALWTKAARKSAPCRANLRGTDSSEEEEKGEEKPSEEKEEKGEEKGEDEREIDPFDPVCDCESCCDDWPRQCGDDSYDGQEAEGDDLCRVRVGCKGSGCSNDERDYINDVRWRHICCLCLAKKAFFEAGPPVAGRACENCRKRYSDPPWLAKLKEEAAANKKSPSEKAMAVKKTAPQKASAAKR